MAINLKFKKGNINSPATKEKGSIIIDSDNKKIYLDTSTSERILIGTTDYNDLSNQPTLVKTGGDVTITNGIISVNDNSHNHAASNITSGTIATARLPAASGTAAGITIVYPAASCTTFSSDSGTVTPAAVQKGAKQFSIPRPNYNQSTHKGSATINSIPRFEEDGAVKESKIIIEDVTNTKDSSKKANVLSIPAEGGKKMVYGYCTDQVDGTSFIGGVFDASATTYPYAAGLAIGGTSGNLLWKGSKVAVTSDINNNTITIKQNNVNKGSFTLNQSSAATIELTDTTYSAASQSANGLMSAADKKKLDGIAENANNYTYTLPNASSSTLGGVKIGSNISVSSGTISLTKNNVTAALGYTPPTTDNNTTYTFATGDNNGQIKVTPSGGSAQNVSVKGLGSAAYTASTAYRASSWTPTAADVGAVPTSRKVNGKALSSDITLSASDVNARASTWMPSAADVGAVPTSRTVNGLALSSNITLNASHVGALPSNPTQIELNNGGNATSHGGYIDFHFGGTTTDYTSRIIENTSGSLSVNGLPISGGAISLLKVGTQSYGSSVPSSGTAGQVYIKTTGASTAWKKVSVTTSAGEADITCSGVTTSSAVIATRNCTGAGGNYAQLLGGCYSNGKIHVGNIPGSTLGANTYNVTVWWSK